MFGPVTTAGGLNDGIPPSMILGTQAQDVPDDEGGRVEVTWEANTEEDCSFTQFTLCQHLVGSLPQL